MLRNTFIEPSKAREVKAVIEPLLRNGEPSYGRW
jgi:hypothetical protein